MPPETSDTTFVVDAAPGLDTGCSFRNQGPLVFDILVTRFPGDIARLRNAGLISPTATLRMPAFDVDFDASFSGINPERDRVSFNGRVVPSEFLTGANNIWKLNAFEIPIEWVHFPTDPVAPARNTIRIDIDTANTGLVWCTAIDWAALSFEVAKPLLLVHGILSSGVTWETRWVPGINALGLPVATIDMGALDSIQNNAAKIASKVTELRSRWGIDRLNIVAHSKGGIDARHYIEGSNTVATMAQIGTPNAGSPLADAVQAGLIVSFGTIPTAILDTLAGPAGVQLTTPYMALYNAFHGANANTAYVSLAGDYRFGGLGLTDALLSAFYGGPNDTIVPVSSVHALDFAAHFTFISTGDDIQARHTSQTGSSAIFSQALPLVTGLDPPVEAAWLLAPQAAGAVSATAPPTRTASIADTIQQGQTKTHRVFMDGLAIGFTLHHGTGTLGFALISPSGIRIDPAQAQLNPDVEHRTFGDVDGLRFENYMIRNPEIGEWTVEVSGTSVVNASGSEPYFVFGWIFGAPISLAAEADRNTYRTGDSIIVRARLSEGGVPVIAATATAKVVSPDGSFELVILTDDGAGDDAVAGDGIYTGRFSSTGQSGLYRILVTVSRTLAPAFSREAMILVPVSSSSSRLTGFFADSGIDTDGDGLFNELVVDVGVNVTASGQYRIVGELVDQAGVSIATASTTSSLGPGMTSVQLRFDGRQIFDQAVDGPYTLGVVRGAEDDGFAVLPLDEIVNAHRTAAYSYRQFQRPAILILGTGVDQGVDADGDGLFDSLQVVLDVDVLRDGSYSWTARLVASNGVEVGFASNSGFLQGGARQITLTFDGRTIGQGGIDGPYTLGDMLMFGANTSAVAFRVYQTEAYRVAQFEGAVIRDTTPPFIEAQVTPAPNAAGWNNSDVTVSWILNDPESGIAVSSGCSNITLTNEGIAVLNCSVTNGAGLTNSVSITVKIDKTAPLISGLPASDCSLWPPNHQLVQVAAVVATDGLSGLAPSSFLVMGSSNEPDSGTGDGDTSPDIVIMDGTVQLRAERSGTGNGRLYTITANAVDIAGNAATINATCTVPHDNSSK